MKDILIVNHDNFLAFFQTTANQALEFLKEREDFWKQLDLGQVSISPTFLK
jgi:hypothetical protein